MFRKQEDPKTAARQAKRDIKQSQRGVEREVRALERTEEQLIADIKRESKKGNQGAVRALAKQLVAVRQQKERMMMATSRMQSMQYQTQSMAATHTLATAMEGATKVMGKMNKSLEDSGAMKTMQEFARQQEMSAVREEMLDEVLADAFDSDEVDAEADTMVSQVLADIGLQIGSQMAEAPSHSVPGQQRADSISDADVDAYLAELRLAESKQATAS